MSEPSFSKCSPEFQDFLLQKSAEVIATPERFYRPQALLKVLESAPEVTQQEGVEEDESVSEE